MHIVIDGDDAFIDIFINQILHKVYYFNQTNLI
jgi:hypothetical protein